MDNVWDRCRGHAEGTLAPIDQVDAIWLWAAGEAAIAAHAVAALSAPALDVPLVVGSGAQLPAWVGGATLCIAVDPDGDGARGGVVEAMLERGGAVIGLTRDEALSDQLDGAGHTAVIMPDEPAVLPPVVVPLLEIFDLADDAASLAAWSVPDAWTEPEGLPSRIAVAAAGARVPAVYGSDGIGAVAAEWMAGQMRLFTGAAAVGASFGDALTHLPAWPTGLTPVAWLVARDAEAGVAEAFDAAVEGVVTVRCDGHTDAERLAELIALADMTVSTLAR